MIMWICVAVLLISMLMTLLIHQQNACAYPPDYSFDPMVFLFNQTPESESKGNDWHKWMMAFRFVFISFTF